MAASSSQNVGSSIPLHLQEEEQQIVPVISCSIPRNELEVICELMVDFDCLEEHQFHLKDDMLFQGWTSLFVVVTENILRMMFDLRNSEGVFESDQRTDWNAVLTELYTDVKKTNRVKDMKDLYQVWIKILLGCFYHRKATHSHDFVNKEQQFILSELPEVSTKYLNSLKEDEAKKVPAKVSRKKASTSRKAVSEVVSESAQEVVVNKERRTKCKFDSSSVNQEKEVQEEVAAVVDENATEKNVVAEAEAVLVESEQEAVEEEVVKRKRKKSNKEQEEENQEVESQEAESREAMDKEKERLATAIKRDIALGKAKVMGEKKNKKQKRLEAEFAAIQNMSKGIHFSEPDSVPGLRSEVTPTDVAQSPEPENQP
ncbi:uncharacterized protein LOC131614009 [Vicia villosa]|uniref:uncharacterized protein LOC131614009 n=1 Tax=Vicia villosa TaxID=3911 RepID=UPI00273A9C09|nr:uncharacterized protein LOC131614009 [Vicia villosa]